jgi:hypothetical protein
MASSNRVHDRMQQLLATSDEPLSVIEVSARLVAVQRAARCDARQYFLFSMSARFPPMHISLQFSQRVCSMGLAVTL